MTYVYVVSESAGPYSSSGYNIAVCDTLEDAIDTVSTVLYGRQLRFSHFKNHDGLITKFRNKEAGKFSIIK
jgi:hypothetical protein